MSLVVMQADSEWLYVVPWGLRKLLVWIHKRYNGPDIYVLENGVDCPKESAVPLPGQLLSIWVIAVVSAGQFRMQPVQVYAELPSTKLWHCVHLSSMQST